jgi:hypothetical protein
MAKIYSTKKLVSNPVNPKKEIISFLLNYSKALSVVHVKGLTVQILAN